MFSGLFRLARSLFSDAAREVRRQPGLFAGILAAVVGAALVTFPHDVFLSALLMEHRTDALRHVARQFSSLGDYPTGTLAVVALLALWGWLRKRDDLKAAAMACLLAASMAGLGATALRTLTGRPRPSAGVEDGFYGPHFDRNYQSFGSAHAATSLATTTALAVAMPAVGAPLFVLSLGVPWARFYMHDHYLTDLIIGSGIGIAFGLAFGLASRSRRNRAYNLE